MLMFIFKFKLVNYVNRTCEIFSLPTNKNIRPSRIIPIQAFVYPIFNYKYLLTDATETFSMVIIFIFL